MRIEKQGFIFDVEETKTEKKVCTFTGLFKHSNGRIFAGFRIGTKKDSTDGNGVVAEFINETEWKILFSDFETVFEGRKGDIKAVELFERKNQGISAILSWFDCSKGSKLYNSSSDTILPGKLILVDSPDMGKTWQNYRVIDTQSLPGPALTGPIIRISAGYLAFFETYGPEKNGGPSYHAARVLFSKDGSDFTEIKTVARDPDDLLYFWDQRNSFDPGSQIIISMFWTYDRKKEKDSDIHIAYGDIRKLNWSFPSSTGIRGQIAAPIPVSGTELLCFYVHRHYPGSMRLIKSEDRGKTWRFSEELVVYQNPERKEKGVSGESSYAEYWEDMNTWSFGHPAGILLDNNRVLLAYYAGKEASLLSARYSIVSVH